MSGAPLRVLLLTSDWKWTGPAEPMLELAAGLRERGHEVALACPEAARARRARTSRTRRARAGLAPRLGSAAGAACGSLRDAARCARACARSSRPSGFDVLHAFHTRDHALALRAAGLGAARGAARRGALLAQGESRFRAAPWSRWLFGPGTDGLHCVSPGVAERCRALRGGRPTRGWFGAVDVERFTPRPPDPAVRASLGLAPERPRGRHRGARPAPPALRPAARSRGCALRARSARPPPRGGARHAARRSSPRRRRGASASRTASSSRATGRRLRRGAALHRRLQRSSCPAATAPVARSSRPRRAASPPSPRAAARSPRSCWTAETGLWPTRRPTPSRTPGPRSSPTPTGAAASAARRAQARRVPLHPRAPRGGGRGAVSRGAPMTELFVPGRLCLFGEHSDWAGRAPRGGSLPRAGLLPRRRHRPGAAGGGRALRRPLRDRERAAGRHAPRALPRPGDRVGARARAREGGFFAYAAGTAAELLARGAPGGVALRVRSDLPVRKGLSSSAAACVLVARAFDRCYGLGLGERGEIEAAFAGERRTGSECGRMDQICAYGRRAELPALRRRGARGRAPDARGAAPSPRRRPAPEQGHAAHPPRPERLLPRGAGRARRGGARRPRSAQRRAPRPRARRPPRRRRRAPRRADGRGAGAVRRPGGARLPRAARAPRSTKCSPTPRFASWPTAARASARAATAPPSSSPGGRAERDALAKRLEAELGVPLPAPHDRGGDAAALKPRGYPPATMPSPLCSETSSR